MKKLLTLSLAFVCGGTAMAQKQALRLPASITPEIRKHYEFVNRLLHSQQAPEAAKTTAVKQRLLAESNYDLTGIVASMIDTIRCSYTGINGSKFDFNQLVYNYDYNPIAANPFSFSIDDNQPDVKTDSVRGYEPGSSGPELLARTKTQYNSSQAITDFTLENYLSGGTLDNAERFITTYDAQGRLSMVLDLAYNGSTWDSLNKKQYSYNAQGLLAKDSTYAHDGSSWIISNRNIRTYNSSSQLLSLKSDIWDGSTWVPDFVSNMTYYTGGKLKDVLFSIDTGGPAPVPFFKDSLGYVSGTDYFQVRQISIFNGSAFDPLLRFSKHINAQNLPDTLLVEQLDPTNGWVFSDKGSFAYNSFSNPTQILTLTENNVPTLQRNYYYEQYNDPTGVREAARADMKVYPNPATDLLHIEWKNAVQNAAVSLTLSNLAGQKVYNEQLSWKGQSLQISTGSLAPGLYLLSVADAQGNALYQQKVVKGQ